MSRTFWAVVIVVILLGVGGWWYINQPNMPGSPATQLQADQTISVQPSASLSSSAMTESSGIFTVKGTAMNLKNGIEVLLVPATYTGKHNFDSAMQFLETQHLGTTNVSASSKASTGAWSVAFGTYMDPASGQEAARPVAPGTYTVLVYNAYDSDPAKSSALLATGTLTVQ